MAIFRICEKSYLPTKASQGSCFAVLDNDVDIGCSSGYQPEGYRVGKKRKAINKRSDASITGSMITGHELTQLADSHSTILLITYVEILKLV